MRELSAITCLHLRILPITSTDNPRNISPQFTRLNIRTSAAPHIRILPEASTVGGETSSEWAKRPGGETSWGRNVQGAKLQRGEASCYQNNHRAF